MLEDTIGGHMFAMRPYFQRGHSASKFILHNFPQNQDEECSLPNSGTWQQESLAQGFAELT